MCKQEMIYSFNEDVILEELDYQERIDYKGYGSRTLAHFFALAILTHYSPGKVREDIFRAALATEIFLRIDALLIEDRDWFVACFDKQMKRKREGLRLVGPVWEDRERAAKIEEKIIEPSIQTVLKYKDYFEKVNAAFDNLLDYAVHKYRDDRFAEKAQYN